MNPAKDFLVVAAFFVGFFLSTIGETEWLNRRTSAGISRSLFVAFTSNIFSITLGYFFSYFVFLVAFGIVPKSISGWSVLSTFLWAAFILAVASAPLAIAKRLLLRVMKISALTRPWIYALVAALAFQISVLLLPFLIAIFE